MVTVTVWLLLATGGHGYWTVPDLPSQQECERLSETLAAKTWGSTWKSNHICVRYERSSR